MPPIRRLALTMLALVLIAPASFGDGPEIAGKVRPFVERGTLAGAVMLVASPDEVLALEAVGFSDVGSRAPMRVDSLFWIASMNKAMTAATLMMLVDEGKVGLDDPAEKHLPEFRGQMRVVERDANLLVLKKPARPIRVRDLLSHTSGLIGRSPLERELDMLPIREGVITYALTPLQVEPGTRYQYNNPGITTIGRIIEVVSGKPYEVFLQERLLDPLGMKDTTFWPDEAGSRRLAKAYKPGPGRSGLAETTIAQLTHPLTDRTRRHPYPGGGLFSTASDVGSFCRMILNGGTAPGGRRLLSESSVREMTSTQTGDLLDVGKGEKGYGLGWNTTRKSPGPSGPAVPGTCSHGGALATQMAVDPGRRLVTVFLVQHDGYPGDGDRAYPAFVKAAEEAFARP